MTKVQWDKLLRNQLCDDCKHVDVENGEQRRNGVIPTFRFCHKKTSPLENKNYVRGNCVVITMTCNRFEANDQTHFHMEGEDLYEDHIRGHLTKRQFKEAYDNR
jgi:hypothetical protein